MELLELKSKIKMQLETADKQLLTIVSSVFDNYSNQIIAYSSDGKPLNLEAYNHEIDKGLDDLKNGRIVSHQDLFNEINTWKNE